MTLREANLAALHRTNPGVAQVLASHRPGAEKGSWSQSRSGLPTVRRNGIQLASTFDPVSEAAKSVPGWDGSVDFILLPGFGAGYLAEAVSGRYPDLPVISAEQDPGWVAEVLVHRDLSELFSHPFFILLLGPDPSVVGEFLGGLACKTVETLVWRPLADQESRWHQALTDQVSQAQARSLVNLATYRRFGSLWARNLLKNERSAPEVRPVSSLTGLGAGAPAVIAAAGPSLAGAFPWMKAHRDRYILVAVDTAWPSLAAQGLFPDVLLVLDGQYWNSRHVDILPPETTAVVTEWTGPPRAFRLNPGKTFVAATSIPFIRHREEARWGALGNLPSGGSVATAAWSLILLMGCAEVAFAGLDLGFPRDQTHVPGSQFEETLHRKSRRFHPAETLGLGLRGLTGLGWRPALDGGLVLSDHRMDLFRSWLSAAVRSRPDVRAYNLGILGSVVPGLLSVGPDFGESWPRLTLKIPSQKPLSPVLVSAPSQPPFLALRAFTENPRSPGALDRAWGAAEGFWGGEVWGKWAGRAKKTWDRFPSDRSLRSLVEVVGAALTWEQFWKS